MWALIDMLLWGALLGAGYVAGRVHTRRLLDRERAFGVLANLPDWEIHARALEQRAYARSVGRHHAFDYAWQADAAALRRAADEERRRGRERDAEWGAGDKGGGRR